MAEGAHLEVIPFPGPTVLQVVAHDVVRGVDQHQKGLFRPFHQGPF